MSYFRAKLNLSNPCVFAMQSQWTFKPITRQIMTVDFEWLRQSEKVFLHHKKEEEDESKPRWKIEVWIIFFRNFHPHHPNHSMLRRNDQEEDKRPHIIIWHLTRLRKCHLPGPEGGLVGEGRGGEWEGSKKRFLDLCVFQERHTGAYESGREEGAEAAKKVRGHDYGQSDWAYVTDAKCQWLTSACLTSLHWFKFLLFKSKIIRLLTSPRVSGKKSIMLSLSWLTWGQVHLNEQNR